MGDEADNLGTISISFVRIKVLEDNKLYPWPKRQHNGEIYRISRSRSVKDPRFGLSSVRGTVREGLRSNMGRLEHSIRQVFRTQTGGGKELTTLSRISKQEILQDVEPYETGTVQLLDTKTGSSWMHFEFHVRCSG